MPVLITIAAINRLFSSGSESDTSFLVPSTLRAAAENRLKPSSARDQMLALVHELEQLATDYRDAAESSIGAYVRQSQQPHTTDDDLVALMQPWDQRRQSALEGILDIRDSIRHLLTDEEWEKVFG